MCLFFRDFLLCWRHIYESFLSIRCNWAGKKLQKTASKGFVSWSNDIFFKNIFPKAHSSVLPAEALSLVPEYSAEMPWVRSDAHLQEKHK